MGRAEAAERDLEQEYRASERMAVDEAEERAEAEAAAWRREGALQAALEAVQARAAAGKAGEAGGAGGQLLTYLPTLGV